MDINFMLIGVVLFLAIMIAKGYRLGFVQEISNLVGLSIAIIAVSFIAAGVEYYRQGQYRGMGVCILLFIILIITAHIVRLVFASAKFLAKLPLLHWMDKMAGMLTGAAQGLILVWIGYIAAILFRTTWIGNYVLSATSQSQFLTFLYENNYVANFIMGL